MDREMLDPRLLCVAKHIRRGSVLADIGTDHGYLPVWLLQNGTDPACIRWVVPHDAWLLDRANLQPGVAQLPRFFGALAGWKAG